MAKPHPGLRLPAVAKEMLPDKAWPAEACLMI